MEKGGKDMESPGFCFGWAILYSMIVVLMIGMTQFRGKEILLEEREGIIDGIISLSR